VTSAINYTAINENFPVAGQDNDTQVFRDNFDTIKTSLSTAKDEITDLQDNTAKLNNDNDFGLNIVQRALLQNNRDQKFDLGFATASPTTFDYENGSYQIITLGADVTMDFLSFPGDPVFTTETSPIGVGKATLEIYSNGGTSVNAVDVEADVSYVISTVGTTDFVSEFGAADNNVGTVFTASASGTGGSGSGTCVITRLLNFQTSGSTVIKKDPNFPVQISIDQSDDPIFIEVWRHRSDEIFMRYLGKYSE
jgi:hypothetical protein